MTVELLRSLTKKQTNALEELRNRVTGEFDFSKYNENHLLYRFLKAREWNVDDAETMLRKSFQWRRNNRIDFITKEYQSTPFMNSYFKPFLFGYDKEGCPAYYIPIGRLDVKGLVKSATYEDSEKYLIKLCEEADDYLESEGKKLNKVLAGYFYVFDLKNLSLSSALDKEALSYGVGLAQRQQDNYPERLKIVYIINVPPFISILFNLVKGFIAEGVLKKLRFMAESDNWQEELLKHIDAEQLPAYLGGNKTDPDGNRMCISLLNQGGKIDEKWYLNEDVKEAAACRKLVLPAASSIEVPMK